MAQERIILDPAEKITGRTELDLTDWIDQNGVDWGEGAANAYYAEGERGQTVLDTRYDNRQIAAGLVLKDRGGTAFGTIRSYLQAKVALYQQEGGILKRVLATGGTVYADVVSGGIDLSGGWLQAHKDADVDSTIAFEAIPDFYEPEVEVASAEEKTATELIKVIADPGGDMPARVRVEVIEKQGADQRSLIWSFRSRHYSSVSSAKVPYEAEELQALGDARKAAFSGASNGTVVQHGTLSTNWTPLLGGRIGGTLFPTHTGTNRMIARAYSSFGGTAVRVRTAWDIGDLTFPTENEGVRMPGESAFFLLDLGEVRLNAAPVGTHRWDWQIQGAGDEGNEDLKIDKVWIVNSDEGMGILSAPINSAGSGFSPFAARDEFNQSAGTLTGKVLTTGGTWTAGAGGTDFSVNATSHLVERTSTADTASEGRYTLAGTATSTSVVAQVDLMHTAAKGAGSAYGALVAGYVDGGNNIKARLSIDSDGKGQISIAARVSALQKVAATVSVSARLNAWYTMRFQVAGSLGAVWFGPKGSNLERVWIGELTLPAGKVGIYDERTSGAGAGTRSYDNFLTWTPNLDAVVYASQKVQLTTDGMYRLDSGGSAYGPVSRVTGDLPRLPAGGLEGRSVELFLKASRGGLEEGPDSAIDDIAVKVFASRSWLTVPGTI